MGAVVIVPSRFAPGQIRPLLECAEPCASCMRCTRSELLDELGDPGVLVEPQLLPTNGNAFIRDRGASIFPDAFAFVDYDPDIHGFYWDH